MLSRRTFLKTGCVAALSLSFISMLGCASAQDSRSMNSNNASNDNVNAVSDSTNESEKAMNAQRASTPSTSLDTAVVYFSCTGNTEKVAEKIATATGGPLLRIEPAILYSSADLNYNSDCRANDEQNDPTARPALASPIPDISSFDAVYLGYPIWWSGAPKVILTFLEETDLAGKTVVPFCTSGSSGISGSMGALESAAPDSRWIEGQRFSASVSQQEIDAWVSGVSAQIDTL